MLPLDKIVRNVAVDFHFCAGDIQLYIWDDPSTIDAPDKLQQYLTAVNEWISNNLLKLNEEINIGNIFGPQDTKEEIKIKGNDTNKIWGQKCWYDFRLWIELLKPHSA